MFGIEFELIVFLEVVCIYVFLVENCFWRCLFIWGDIFVFIRLLVIDLLLFGWNGGGEDIFGNIGRVFVI